MPTVIVTTAAVIIALMFFTTRTYLIPININERFWDLLATLGKPTPVIFSLAFNSQHNVFTATTEVMHHANAVRSSDVSMKLLPPDALVAFGQCPPTTSCLQPISSILTLTFNVQHIANLTTVSLLQNHHTLRFTATFLCGQGEAAGLHFTFAFAFVASQALQTSFASASQRIVRRVRTALPPARFSLGAALATPAFSTGVHSRSSTSVSPSIHSVGAMPLASLPQFDHCCELGDLQHSTNYPLWESNPL
mmetsp:Transcript_48539/g.135662  ORF Transcript_48539/g.135662 Transcript_48539/m.135662 type:complete len:250 (-) Transcript_48539:56-805(-)